MTGVLQWSSGELFKDESDQIWLMYEDKRLYEFGEDRSRRLSEVGTLVRVYVHTADELTELEREAYNRGWSEGHDTAMENQEE